MGFPIHFSLMLAPAQVAHCSFKAEKSKVYLYGTFLEAGYKVLHAKIINHRKSHIT